MRWRLFKPRGCDQHYWIAVRDALLQKGLDPSLVDPKTVRQTIDEVDRQLEISVRNGERRNAEIAGSGIP